MNQVGSLFYGGMLGVFVLAFFVKQVGRHRRVLGSDRRRSRDLRHGAIHPDRFLWYNVIGCLVVVAVGW